MPDDQGNLSLCTQHAVAKALANGFFQGKYSPFSVIDFDQSEIVTAILNFVSKACWPEELNGRKLVLQCKSTMHWWDVICNVQRVKEPYDLQEIGIHEHVVIKKRTGGNSLHSVYLDEIIEIMRNDHFSQTFLCLNSWGNDDPIVRVHLDDIYGFYRVTASATELPGKMDEDYAAPGS